MVAQPLGRILVVDDDPSIVDVIVDYFGAAGYEVLSAHHGGDALMLTEQEHPDVVLLDIRMAGLSGVEVLQQIKLRWRELPVIMVSGAGDASLAQRCLTRGALDYIAKPFDLEHLHRCVSAALAGGGTRATAPPRPASA